MTAGRLPWVFHGSFPLSEAVAAPPATGALGIVRLYLPMQEQPVEIDWIAVNGEKADFYKAGPFWVVCAQHMAFAAARR